MNIVFVCTSNTCRSPISELFAVEWFHRRLKLSRPEQEAKGIIVRSGAYVAIVVVVEMVIATSGLTRGCRRPVNDRAG